MSADNNTEEDLRSPREKASKIPSWIMVGFILGALTFYTVSDYLNRPEKEQPSAPSGTQSSGTAQPTDTAATDQQSPAPAATASGSDAPKPSDTPAPPENARYMSLLVMDAIFRQWSVNAMWEYNTTQVVFWNPADNKYSVAVEVFRIGGNDDDGTYYYRMIDRPTRPVIRNDSRPDAPILFTESEDATQRRKENENQRWWR
ncbi:hypothetical protein M2447_002594 [Ereboglobus sp. PH5-10]|uniref:hypothetical protein n=1 Tax=Ereboglobus sp. PH5-10 TaxID=2940629 RepID=UPI00240678FE|nr:hypothetical protein [Ereboglobus sp. PH5-10]MDF9828472.1 hypothetical protein [Ereboglobus sp. PH5-10]